MAGMVSPTTILQAAQVQKLFDIDVRKAPVISVAKQVKKESLRPILLTKIKTIEEIIIR